MEALSGLMVDTILDQNGENVPVALNMAEPGGGTAVDAIAIQEKFRYRSMAAWSASQLLIVQIYDLAAPPPEQRSPVGIFPTV